MVLPVVIGVCGTVENKVKAIMGSLIFGEEEKPPELLETPPAPGIAESSSSLCDKLKNATREKSGTKCQRLPARIDHKFRTFSYT